MAWWRSGILMLLVWLLDVSYTRGYSLVFIFLCALTLRATMEFLAIRSR